MQALEVYRREFRPSKHLDKPYVMIGVPVVASETDEKAEYLATSIYQRFVSLVRGNLRQTPPPVPTMTGLWNDAEEAQAKNMTRLMACGGPEKIKREISGIVEMTGADELIITSDLYDNEERLRSFEILMNAVK
jgi:alkanesulfonate monooxygenase SsuD/methylene tetrahydromethanopterin reductase-like flavin-dependent oxidoreductase (luciferase family)